MATDDRLKYKFSRDYERLWQLLNDGQRIVCFVDCYEVCRDVCTIRMDDEGRVNLGARGIDYWAGPFSIKPSFKGFADNVADQRLEFIDPDQ